MRELGKHSITEFNGVQYVCLLMSSDSGDSAKILTEIVMQLGGYVDENSNNSDINHVPSDQPHGFSLYWRITIKDCRIIIIDQRTPNDRW